jgi:ribosomal RNA-processing protein 36
MPQKHSDNLESSHRGRGVRRPQLEKTTGFARPDQARQFANASRSIREPVQNIKTAYHKEDDSSDSSRSASDSESGGEGNSDAESSEGHAEQAELDRLREGVKDVPFEMVQKLSALGSSRAAEHGENSSRRERGPAHVKRANKNAPQEVSSKIRVGIIPAHLRAAARERKGRDPRFDRLSGKLSEDLFEKSYAWLKDVAQRDAKELRDVASKEKDADARGEMLLRASQIEQKLKQDAKKGEETQLKRARKKAMADVVSSTGQAFWLKKRELRQIEIARKYETLKAKGQSAVDDYGNARFNGSTTFMHLAIHIDNGPSPHAYLQSQRSASAPRRRTTASSLAVDEQTIDPCLAARRTAVRIITFALRCSRRVLMIKLTVIAPSAQVFIQLN